MQSLVSATPPTPRNQGQTMGAVSVLNSLMAVVAPVIGRDPLMAMVSHLPQGDWRIGAPMFFCAALQAGPAAGGAALPPPARATLPWLTLHS
jgi:DHA1 family tetracycline resistance protein-like MFS transporter